MTQRFDLHTHSRFCDGRNTPEEMVLAAIDKGLTRIGICTHAYVPFDPDFCIAESRYPEFQAELARLKEKYADRIEVLCGVEQDYYSPHNPQGFDYVIGSVHYLQCGSEYLPVDNTPALLEAGCRTYFGGDYYALCEAYFATVSRVFEQTRCDLIGHFDLVAKLNDGERYFKESDPRYLNAAFAAVDALLPCGKPFEINTGAISRGYRTIPYPAPAIRDYILARGGTFLLSSDAHNTASIAYLFDRIECSVQLH